LVSEAACDFSRRLISDEVIQRGPTNVALWHKADRRMALGLDIPPNLLAIADEVIE
jgi:hypothetical protein